VNPIPWRTQLRLVWAGYAAVAMVSAGLVFIRYLQYVRNPAEAAAASGMYAGGDVILGLFIACLFVIPTFFLVLVIRKSEPAFTLYSKVVLGFSLTAPLSLSMLAIPTIANRWDPGGFFLYRLMVSPIVLVAMAGSRLMARFPLQKKLTLYALLIELATVGLIVVFVFVSFVKH